MIFSASQLIQFIVMNTIVADLSVLVVVGVIDQLLDLSLGQLSVDVGHDEPQLLPTDVARLLLVEDAERLADLLLRVRALDLLRHHVEELGEVDRPAACGGESTDTMG